MAEIATLILGADAAGLLKGEAALNSIVKTAETTETRVAGAMDGIADAMTGTGTAATTSAKVISTADTSKARSADLAAQAIRAATATETLARNTAAQAAQGAAKEAASAELAKVKAAQAAADAIIKAEQQAAAARDRAASSYASLRTSLDPVYASSMRYAQAVDVIDAALRDQIISQAEANRMTAMAGQAYLAADPALKKAAGSAVDIGKQSGFAAGGGVRMLGQQLSQVAQQGAVTGNYLGALAVQLPDMALGFGSVAVAASIVATVAMPLLIGAFGNGKTAAEGMADANSRLYDSIDILKGITTDFADGSLDALVKKYGEADAALLQLIGRQREQAVMMAQTAARDAVKSLTSEYGGLLAMIDAGGRAGQTATIQLANALGMTANQGIALRDAMREVQAATTFDEQSAAMARVDALLASSKINGGEFAVAITKSALALREAAFQADQSGEALGQATVQAHRLGTPLTASLGLLLKIADAQPGPDWLSTAIARVGTLRGALYGAYEASLKAMAAATTPDLSGPAGMGDASTAFASEMAKKLASAEAAAEAYRRKIIEIPDAASNAGTASVAAADAATDALKEAADAAKAYADALNAPVTSAIDGVANAWGDLVAGGFRDFKDFTKGILGSFQGMLSDMIAMSLRNKIMISLGMGTTAMTGVAAAGSAATGAAASAAGGGILTSSFGALGGLTGIGAAPAAGAASGFMAALPAIGVIAGGISLLAGLFARTTTGSGISGTYAGDGFSGSSYSTSKNAFGSRTSTSALSDATSDGIATTLGDLRGSVVDMADTLNIGADALAGFTASIKISTFGLSAEQKAKAIETALMKVGDDMAGLLLASGDYAKAGETQLDALTRLSQSLPRVNGVLAMLGDEVYSVGLIGADAASKLADAFGGLEAMATASKTYFDLFFSDAEKLSANTQAVQTAFARLGLALPATRDAYRAMVAAQDLSTQSGRDLYAALVSMAGAMDQVLPIAAQLTQALANLVSSAGGQLDAMISGTEAAMSAAEFAASQWYDAAKGLRDFIADLRGASSDLASAEATRAYNEARFQMLLAQAMAGSQSAYKDLTGAAGALLDSTNETASTSVEAALQQARVIADLDKAANVADIGGAKNDVVAGLLRQQRAILTEVKDYLAGGGVLDPANIDALNSQLGSLQGAIADAQSIDYAQVVASLDVTATLISKVDDPALKALLENASHEIEGTVAFTADTAGLTPAQRFLALHAATSTIRTVKLLADTTGISATDAALALATNSTALTAITATLTSTMSDQDKMLALVTSDNITRTVNMALGEVNADARELALTVASDIIRNVSTTIAAADANSLATRLALIASSDVTRTVITSLGETNAEAKLLALAASSDITRMISAYVQPGTLKSNGVLLGLAEDSSLTRMVKAFVEPGTLKSNGVLLGLATASVLARTVTAQLTTPASDAAVLLALGSSRVLIRRVVGSIGGETERDALELGLATGSALIRHVDAMKAGNINQAAWDLGLAADSLLVRGVTARWSGQGVDAAFRFAQQDNSLLIRNVTATWSPDVIGTARDLALSTGGLLSRTVGAVWGAITPNMIALALATDSDLTKTITGEVDLTGLTDEQLDFLNALTGSTGGMITLGGSFLWDPSTGFQTWLESTTFDNIADPLNALIAPMAALRGELTSLTSEIRIQNAADEAARAEAVRVKALAEATAAGEKLLADRGAAVSKLTSVVSQIDALDAAHSTNFINNKNQRVDIGVNADGTLTDNINPWLEYTSTTDLAAFRAKWSADGGLQDQLFAANDARAVIDRALAAARQQVINLGGVPTFAQGGNHSGGFRIVGESGPELEATGAARYYSARDTARMIGSGGDNRELVQEIRELRNEVKSLREQSDRLDTQILNQTKRNTRLQEQWEKTGMPPERATL